MGITGIIAFVLILFCGGILIDELMNGEFIKEANLSIEGSELVAYCNLTGPANVTAEFYSDKEGAAYSRRQLDNVIGWQRIDMGNISKINGSVYVTARSRLFWRNQMVRLSNSPNYPVN